MNHEREGLLNALDAIDLTYYGGIETLETTRSTTGIADDLLAELQRRGWTMERVDPFVAADPPPGCCGGWIGPSGERTMCCPVASPGPSDEALSAALDAFQEAAEANGYDRTEGTINAVRRSRERLHKARVALVRLVMGERAGSTNAPAFGGADVEPGDLVLTRQGVLDAFTERLTKIEDWIDQKDKGWQYRSAWSSIIDKIERGQK